MAWIIQMGFSLCVKAEHNQELYGAQGKNQTGGSAG